jgi:hypothetical protein
LAVDRVCEPPEHCHHPIEKLERELDALRIKDTPRSCDLDRCPQFLRRTGGDPEAVKAIASSPLVTLGKVQTNRRGRATNLIVQLDITSAQWFERLSETVHDL